MIKIDKRRSIGLAAKELNLKDYVIRFWETQFPKQIKPTVGRGNRRYYFDKDVDVLRKIKYFLHEEGYTIKGLQKLFRNNKNILKKDLGEIKKNLTIDVKKIDKNAMVDTIYKLNNLFKRLKDFVGKLDSISA